MAKPKEEEEEERPKEGYRHAERTAGNFCMLLAAIGGLCWQAKEMMSPLKEGKLTRPCSLLGLISLHGPWREAGEI